MLLGCVTSMISSRVSNEFTVVELAQIIADAVGVPLNMIACDMPPDDPTRRKPYITSRERAGRESKIALHEGLVSTLESFRELTPIG
jgi:nucleoside-diphosphate-sugar epimerase